MRSDSRWPRSRASGRHLRRPWWPRHAPLQPPSIEWALRIATNPRAFDRPLSADEAARQVEEWLEAPRAWAAQPSAAFDDVFLKLVRRYNVTAGLMTDAQLAALAVDHGVPLISTDADFARFSELNWINPLTVDD